VRALEQSRVLPSHPPAAVQVAFTTQKLGDEQVDPALTATNVH
jgi:hypothetical protein